MALDLPHADHDTIDVHTHVVPGYFPAYTGRSDDASWPAMAEAHACHRHVMVSGKVYRTVSHQCWDCSVRARDMATMSLGRQVLSPMPELLSYWMEPEDGAAMARYVNGCIAEMVANDPGRFFGLGMVPLQDIPRAIRELDVLLHGLGLAGVEIGGNVNGVAIGDPRFFPFFEAAADWGASVFVHPIRPSGMDRLVGGPALEQVLAFPGETGLAAASLITGGTLARLPTLRVAFSHGGGSLAALLPRLQHAWDTIPSVQESIALDPTEAARRMYYDNLVYDVDAMRRLVALFGVERVMVGTDYPFPIMDRTPASRLAALALPASQSAMIRHQNALRWLDRL